MFFSQLGHQRGVLVLFQRQKTDGLLFGFHFARQIGVDLLQIGVERVEDGASLLGEPQIVLEHGKTR